MLKPAVGTGTGIDTLTDTAKVSPKNDFYGVASLAREAWYSMGMTASKDDPAAVDEYLAAVPEEQRTTLKKLRKFILSEAPDSTQRVAYGGAVIFRLKSDLVGFAAYKGHLSFFVMSPPLAKKLKDEVKDHKISGATIHFTPDNPLPDSLVRKIIKARIKEQQA